MTTRPDFWHPTGGDPGRSLRVLSVDLPASARRLPVPAEFLQRGIEYKAEVLAIEASATRPLPRSPSR